MSGSRPRMVATSFAICAFSCSGVLAPRSVGKPPPRPSPLNRFSRLNAAMRTLPATCGAAGRSGAAIVGAVVSCRRQLPKRCSTMPCTPVSTVPVRSGWPSFTYHTPAGSRWALPSSSSRVRRALSAARRWASALPGTASSLGCQRRPSKLAISSPKRSSVCVPLSVSGASMRTSMPSSGSQSAGSAVSTVGAIWPVPRGWITGACSAVSVSSPPALRSPTMPRTRTRSPEAMAGAGTPSSKATNRASEVVACPSPASCTKKPPRPGKVAVTMPSSVTVWPSSALRAPSPCIWPMGVTGFCGVTAQAGSAREASRARVGSERGGVIEGRPLKRGGKGKRNG